MDIFIWFKITKNREKSEWKRWIPLFLVCAYTRKRCGKSDCMWHALMIRIQISSNNWGPLQWLAWWKIRSWIQLNDMNFYEIGDIVPRANLRLVDNTFRMNLFPLHTSEVNMLKTYNSISFSFHFLKNLHNFASYSSYFWLLTMTLGTLESVVSSCSFQAMLAFSCWKGLSGLVGGDCCL